MNEATDDLKNQFFIYLEVIVSFSLLQFISMYNFSITYPIRKKNI